MSDDVLRFGVIGTGMMGCEHIRNLKLVPGVRVTAISDPHEASRGWGKLAVGGDVEVYADHRDLLAKAPVDAVVIASPNFTHAAVLADVFRTRKHVLVEKPLCTTVEDCKRVIDASAKHPGLVWVGMEYRFMRPVARLVEEVHGGAVGRLRMLAIREHRFPFLPKVATGTASRATPAAPWWRSAATSYDLMNLITKQRPTQVYGSGAMDVNHLEERYAARLPPQSTPGSRSQILTLNLNRHRAPCDIESWSHAHPWGRQKRPSEKAAVAKGSRHAGGRLRSEPEWILGLSPADVPIAVEN